MIYEAFAYFTRGGRLSFQAESLEEAAKRAYTWFDIFCIDLCGRNTVGEAVTAIGVRSEDGTECYEVEFD